MSTHKNDALASIPVDCISVDVNADTKRLGRCAMEAIGRFSFGEAKVTQYETDVINKNICKWVGARGINSFEKNSRFLLLERDEEENCFIISPCDNFTSFSYQWFFNKDIVRISANSSEMELGKAVQTGFMRATYHPDRKDKKYKESKPVFRLP
jgi:hypothetical protein